MAPYSGLVHVLESGCDCVVLACEVFHVYLQILPSYSPPPMCTFKHSPPPPSPRCVPCGSVQAEAPSRLLFILRTARAITAGEGVCCTWRGGVKGWGRSLCWDEEPCYCNSKLEQL